MRLCTARGELTIKSIDFQGSLVGSMIARGLIEDAELTRLV